jgi:hypothetical protein
VAVRRCGSRSARLERAERAGGWSVNQRIPDEVGGADGPPVHRGGFGRLSDPRFGWPGATGPRPKTSCRRLSGLPANSGRRSSTTRLRGGGRGCSGTPLRQLIEHFENALDITVKVGYLSALASLDRTASQLSASWVLTVFTGGPYGIDASAHRLLEGALRQRRSIGSVTGPSGCVASRDAAHSSGGTGCAELGGDW